MEVKITVDGTIVPEWWARNVGLTQKSLNSFLMRFYQSALVIVSPVESLYRTIAIKACKIPLVYFGS